jgi:hypothetical protein
VFHLLVVDGGHASKRLIFSYSIHSMSDLSLGKLMSPTADLQAKRDEVEKVEKVLSKQREREISSCSKLDKKCLTSLTFKFVRGGVSSSSSSSSSSSYSLQ